MFQRLIYRDGSANSYTICVNGERATFEYVPVTPAQSSTGHYSGGDPRSGQLDAAQIAALWQHVTALEANTALHVTDRGKGTGLFAITDANGERSFIIARGSELAAFDAFVTAS